MKKLRNALAFVLAVMLVFTAVPITALAETTASVADFSDFPTGWSRAAMTDAVENGLIQGYEDLTVRPTDLLTRAQMAAIINRAFGAEVKASIDGNFSDVSQTDWFYEDVQKAVQMKTFNGYDGFFRPNEPITREDAIVVIARALVISMEDTSFLHNFGDKDSVADYAEGAFAAFLERGYIRGYEDTTLRPKNNITREEFAQIMYNIFAEYERASGSVSLGDCEGEVVLTGDNVHLYSTNIAGDLIIGDGVGNTNVTLENVNVAGRILFRGGEGIVTLRNVTKNGLIVVNDVNGTVNFNHYSTESIFTNAVYNTPATFIDKTVSGGSASGTGLGTHDTTVVGRNDAKTGDSGKKDPTLPPINQGTGGGTVVRYTVTVDPDNGEAPTVYTIRRNYSLSSYDYTLPTVTKAGFRFDGWYYMDGTTETEFNERTIIRTATNVYAKWVEQVTVTMPDGSVKTYDKGDKTLGDIRPLLPSDPVKDGFRFDGWQYDDGTGVKDYDDSVVIDKNITISAKWVEQVTVTFNVDGTLTVKTIDINTSLDAAEFPADPVKPGYTFVRWVYNLAGTATEFTSSVIVTGSIVVTPEWADDMATVIFMNEGTEHARLSVRVGETVTALPADPTKEHADFLGWFYTESGIEKQFTTATTVTGDMTVNAKWSGVTYTVTYLNEDGTEFDKTTGITPGSPAGTPANGTPVKTGWKFVGWFYDVSGTETELTAETLVYTDITATAKFEQTFTVNFCEYLDPENIKHTVSGIISGSTVDVSEIETANGNLDERFLYGYEANTSNISATYDKNVKHEIYGAWYYLDGGKYVPFNETVVIDRDIDAFYLFKAMNATVHLDSILGQIGSIALSVNYDEESSVQQTVLDLLWNSTNTTNIKTAANFALDKLLGKNFVISDKIEYMPIDADGEIMNAYYDYRLIDLLGESTIRGYVRDSIYDMVKNDSEILKAAIKQMLSSLGSDADLLDKCDGYITADPDLVNQLKQFINDELATNQELRDELEARALVRFETEWANDTDAFIIAAIRESYPNYDLLPPEQQAALLASVKADPVKVEQIKTAAWLEALDYAMANAADEILADSELRKEAIVRASENETIVNNLTEKIYEKIESEISNPSEENKEFIEEIIDTATAYYDAQIEEFINSLKNEDSYLINYDAVNNIDRRFIISAVRSKLASTTYEEIKEKLPSFVLKVLDEAVLRDIFDTVLNNYKAEVEAVYNAVYPVYDGNDHYVSSSVEIVVNPIEQVLIPYYNKAMAKLDPAIKGSQYYEANPYIKEIEALMHYNQLITKTDKTAPYAGYAIKSVDDYYSLVYKTSVLVYDAGSWFVENVPEDELDNVIKLAAERIGGYYDKLLDKFSALQGDKADKVKNTFENLVAKLLARNNAEIWNNSTDLVLSTKLDELYAKACQVVLDRSGFDITNDIEIEIAADCQSITLSQNGRTITKTLADIAYDIQAGGADVSIDGSVITINGRQIDLAVYLKKIADKIGYNFTVSLIIDNSAVESNNQNLKAYKLNINSDYISVVIQLQ